MTAARPEAVVIDDLAAPRFPPEAEPIREEMAKMGAAVSLEPAVSRYVSAPVAARFCSFTPFFSGAGSTSGFVSSNLAIGNVSLSMACVWM